MTAHRPLPTVHCPLLAALLLGLLLAACGPNGDQPVVHQLVTIDGVARQAEERPVSEPPALDEAAARQRAAPYVPEAAQATAVQARYVALTLADQPIQERPVWLVTFVGAPLEPEGCDCHGPLAASTVIALDGQTGALVLVAGSDEWAVGSGQWAGTRG
jgi:hypothetical protein